MVLNSGDHSASNGNRQYYYFSILPKNRHLADIYSYTAIIIVYRHGFVLRYSFLRTYACIYKLHHLIYLYDHFVL